MHELYTYILSELRGTWRFRWYALIVAWLVAIAGAYMILTLPDQYRVESRIQIDTDSVLQPLLADLAIAPNLDQRVQMLTNTVLRRENVERIARESDMLLEARSTEQENRIVENLGGRINISSARGRGNLYTISYSGRNPEQARQVVQSVIDILTEEALGATRADSASATRFLEEQIEQYEDRLREAEQRLASFKRENMGLLPEQGGRDYYGRLRAAEDQLESLEANMRQAERRRDSLREELTAIEEGRHVDVVNPQVTMMEEQIRQSNQRLDELLLRYTESHPDVRALQAQIERQEERLVALREGPAGDEVRDPSDNPVYQELRIRLNDWNAEVAALETQIEDQQRRIRNLVSRVDEITEVETRLADLTRDYEVTRSRHNTLINRLSTAQMSTDADMAGGQIRFRVVDPPVTPSNPSGPNREIYLLALLPLGFGAGGGLAFLIHQLRPVFHSRTLLAEWAGRPVLGSVSLVMTRRQRGVKLVAITIFGLAVLTLVAAVGAVILYEDLVIERLQWLMRRLPL